MIKIKSDEVKKNPKKQENFDIEKREDFKENLDSDLSKYENRDSKYGLWFLALFSIMFLLFALTFLFTRAIVTINPKIQDIALNQNFSAIKDSIDDNLSFDLVTISGEETKSIQGGEVKDVAVNAKGLIMIYNVFSYSPQTFSADTKLMGSNGKVYKTEKKVIVPGKTKNGIPGSIEVGIYGSEVGEEYNSNPLDFKVVAFKGTSKYAQFYARSEGPIVGGLKGNFSQISDEQKTATINDLKNSLQTKLFKKATDQIPDGYILFKDAVFLDDDGGTVGLASTDNLIPVTLKGTFYGFLFEEKKLENTIIKENIKDYD